MTRIFCLFYIVFIGSLDYFLELHRHILIYESKTISIRFLAHCFILSISWQLFIPELEIVKWKRAGVIKADFSYLIKIGSSFNVGGGVVLIIDHLIELTVPKPNHKGI